MKYEFNSSQDLVGLTKKYKIPISEVAKRFETERSGKTVSTVRNKMKAVRDITYEAVKRGVKTSEKTKTGLAGGDAVKVYQQLKDIKSVTGSKVTLRAMAYALAVNEQNATMGQIVAFPTAGGAGVIPGTLFSAAERFHAGKRKLLRGLFCASAIGLVIAERATLSAAKAGCQAEVGAGAAMAAAGLTEMNGGTPEQCLDAAAIALKSYLGLVCDPLGGLVEVPCIKRNAIACMAAIGASDMAIAGVESAIPFDEVLDAMNDVAKKMSPKLRETALGGLAITKTGNKIKKKVGMPINGK